mgnify:CR=1 FL=1
MQTRLTSLLFLIALLTGCANPPAATAVVVPTVTVGETDFAAVATVAVAVFGVAGAAGAAGVAAA